MLIGAMIDRVCWIERSRDRVTSSLGLRQVGAAERGEVTRKTQESEKSPREDEGRQPATLGTVGAT